VTSRQATTVGGSLAGTGGEGPWSGMNFTVTVAPGGANPITPNGSITPSDRTFTWTRNLGCHVVCAQHHTAGGGTTIHNAWHSEADACSGTTCSFTLPSNLAPGSYEWQVRTWNPYGTNFARGVRP